VGFEDAVAWLVPMTSDRFPDGPQRSAGVVFTAGKFTPPT
jgi:hypothetical protein